MPVARAGNAEGQEQIAHEAMTWLRAGYWIVVEIGGDFEGMGDSLFSI